jgi:hypothetical protein
MTKDLEAACADLDAAMPPGWLLGRPSLHDERRRWIRYAFDPSEMPKVSVRSREWTAVAQTEIGVVREMARCLREISAGPAPR